MEDAKDSRDSLGVLHSDTYLWFESSSPAQTALCTPNAGGNSLHSEALSVQYFTDLGAIRFIYEREIQYNFYNCKMVDFVMTWKNRRVGVSVARAMSFNHQPFSREHADTLLTKKLTGLIIARNCVSKTHSFFTSILHMQCQTPAIASMILAAYQDMLCSSDVWRSDLKGTLTLFVTTIHSQSPYYSYVFNAQPKKKRNRTTGKS